MQKTYKTIEDDIIEDITEETLLSLDQTLEADAESIEIAEAKVKEEEDEEEDADEMEEAMDGVGKEDDDVDNDGDSDETDAYLKNRRKKIAAAIEKQNEEVQLEEAKLTKVDDDEYEMEFNIKPRWDKLWSQDAENPNDPRPFVKTIIADIKKLNDDYQFHAFIEALVKQIKTEAAKEEHRSVDALNDFNKALAKAAAAFAQNGDLEEPDYNIKPYIAKIIGKIDQIALGYQFGVFLDTLVKHTKSLSGESKSYKQFYSDLSKAYSKFDKEVNENMKEDTQLEEGSMDIATIAKKLGLSDAQVNKLEMQSTKQYSKGKGQTMLLDILKTVDDMDGYGRKAGIHYAKTGQFGMLDMIVNDRDADMDENMKEEVDSSDITRLVESEVGLTEQFKEKATLIFETAVRTKVAEAEATLKEEYATRLAEEVETIQEDLVEKIDSYLTYAVESWVADNKVAVESTLRTEIAENFISSLKSVFVENYIDVPEGKTDLVAQMEAELSESQEAAAKLERIAESLAEKVETLSRANVLAEASRDLADTQAARLQSLSEDVQYVDAISFRKKIETLKEFYINSRQNVEEETFEDSSYVSTETIVENETLGETISPSMQNYLTAISRLNNASSANLVG